MTPLLIVPPAMVLIGAWIFRRMCGSHAVGAGLVVFTYVITAISVDPIHFEIAGFNIFLEELVGLALMAATAARIAVRPGVRRQLGGALPFVATTALAFVLGAFWYGIKPAGVEYQDLFGVCAALLYCASFPLASKQMHRLVTIWLAGACVLTALAWFRWTADALQLSIAGQWAVNNGENYWRVLNAGQAFYLGESLLILLYLRRHAKNAGWLSVLAWILAVTVLVLQHRSVYVAVAIGWAVMAWREGAFPRLPRTIAIAAALFLLVYAVKPEWITGENRLKDALLRSVEEPFASDRSTFGWRVNMWQAYLLEYASLPPVQKFVGTGLGNPAIYSINGGDVQAGAHNLFVFLLNRAGIFGLAGFVACYSILLRRVRGTGGCWDYLGMLLTLAVCQLIYCAVYSISYDQGLLAGAALGITSGEDQRRAG